MAVCDTIEYFLGANSPAGFYSLYDQLLPPESARRIYILKGGPGCGKSTLIKAVSAQVAGAGFIREHILCSGDPDSLDGAVFPQLGVALVDGTAPHVIEPRFPGVVECYVNLGDCWDKKGLWDVRQEIMSSMTGYKDCYRRAYRCLSAAAQIREDMRATLITDPLRHRLSRRAAGILSRECKKQKGAAPGQVRQRFLNGVTHRGLVSLYHTAALQCSRIYQLRDRYGLSHELLSPLLSGLTAAGHDVVACPDPMAPERLSHLLIPGLSLAFLSTPPGLSLPPQPVRRLRLDAMADDPLLRRSRPRLRFSQKVSSALMEEAVDSLAQAKEMHDGLEALYHPYINFELVHQTARSITREILSPE